MNKEKLMRFLVSRLRWNFGHFYHQNLIKYCWIWTAWNAEIVLQAFRAKTWSGQRSPVCAQQEPCTQAGKQSCLFTFHVSQPDYRDYSFVFADEKSFTHSAYNTYMLRLTERGYVCFCSWTTPSFLPRSQPNLDTRQVGPTAGESSMTE